MFFFLFFLFCVGVGGWGAVFFYFFECGLNWAGQCVRWLHYTLVITPVETSAETQENVISNYKGICSNYPT